MRLADLSPVLKGGYLRFLCPLGSACPLNTPDTRHSIRVAVERHEGKAEKVWTMSGAFPDTLTITPSIDAYTVKCDAGGNPLEPEQRDKQCWHGFITNGEVR